MSKTDPVAEYKEWVMDGAAITPQAARVLNRLIRKDAGTGRSDGSGRFRGSLIGDPCKRRQQLSYMGAPRNRSDMKYAVAGTFGHYRWQAAGLSAGFMVTIEKVVRYGGWFRAAMDGLLRDGRLFELKTTNSAKAAKLQQAQGNIDAIPQNHYDQVTAMLGASGLEEAVLVYEGRNQLELIPFEVGFDADRFEAIKLQVKEMRAEAESGNLHPVDSAVCPPGSWIRDNCQFRVRCMDLYAEERMASMKHLVGGRPELAVEPQSVTDEVSSG